MSIQEELTTLNNNIWDSYSAIEGKGGTIPAHKNTDNLVTAIESIPTGGGGIPDIDIEFSSILPAYSNDAYTTQTIAVNGGPVHIYISPVNPNHKAIGSGTSASDRQSDVIKYMGQDGLFHLPLDINGTSIDFTTTAPFGLSYANIYTDFDSENYGSYSGNASMTLDLDNAIEWNENGYQAHFKVQNTTIDILGRLYVVPLQFTYAPFNDKYYMKTTQQQVYCGSLAWGRNTKTSAKASAIYGSITMPSRTATSDTSNSFTVGTNNMGISTSEAQSISYLAFPMASILLDDGVDTRFPNKPGYVAFFVKDGKTLSDAKTDLAAEGFTLFPSKGGLKYMEDGVEKTVGMTYTNVNCWVPQSQATKDAWASIMASHPQNLVISIPSGDTSGNKFGARAKTAYTKKLSTLIQNYTTATINVTDPETWETRSFVGVVMADEGIDLTDIDPLSHGGMY